MVQAKACLPGQVPLALIQQISDEHKQRAWAAWEAAGAPKYHVSVSLGVLVELAFSHS